MNNLERYRLLWLMREYGPVSYDTVAHGNGSALYFQALAPRQRWVSVSKSCLESALRAGLVQMTAEANQPFWRKDFVLTQAGREWVEQYEAEIDAEREY